MKDSTLLKWLNWFYTLEMGQVDLYLNQAKESKDQYIAIVLFKVAEIEAKHAELFYDVITSMGEKPAKIDILISYITGFLPGKLTPYLGTVNFFYYNYVIETIAMADYKRLIKKIDSNDEFHQNLLDILYNNLTEEDLHRSWFKDRRESLQRLKKNE